jgi:outer membrane protein OmpA-like peptidoglycan-associated protein
MASATALRAVFGSCLTLGFADLAWLDLNAARMGKEMSSPALMVVESAPSAEPPAVMVRPVPTPAIAPTAVHAPAPPTTSTAAGPTAANTSEPRAAGTPAGATKQDEPISCIVQFERSLSVLPTDEAAKLTVIARSMKDNPRAIARIGGHADRLAWKGNRGDNMQLSEDRAVAVARALTKLGIPSDRIQRAAFGDTRPVDDRATEDAYRRNRRVEVRIEFTGDR